MSDDAPITQRDLVNAVQGATLAVQVAELAKDVGELNRRIEGHERTHEQEKADTATRRRADRRWRIGAAIAAVGGFATLLAAVLDAAGRIH